MEKNASIRLFIHSSVGSLIFDVGESSSLWEVPPRVGIRTQAEQATANKPGRLAALCGLQFHASTGPGGLKS